LGLPDQFSSPVFVRVVPDLESERAPFQVTVEVGGIVSAQLRAEAATMAVTRRALVQALLMRLAVARHGVDERLTVPLWLEDACVGWWRTRSSPSQLDALRQFSARKPPPSLENLFGWQRGGPESPANSAAAMWLFTFLHSESRQPRDWSSFVLTLLRGDDPLTALATNFSDAFTTASDRALWWETGYHQLRRVRTLPALEAADSREQLEALTRFVFVGESDDSDVVVPLLAVLARAHEPVVGAELTRRATELAKLISSLHPFYRNAGLSLGEAFASRNAPPARREAACVGFEQDWRDAVELENATRTALDALERNSVGVP
jgi:hypothetical protein